MSNTIQYRRSAPVIATPEPKPTPRATMNPGLKLVLNSACAIGFFGLVGLDSILRPPPPQSVSSANLASFAPEAPKAPELSPAEKNRERYCDKDHYEPRVLAKEQVRNALKAPSTSVFPSGMFSDRPRVVFVDIEENNSFGRPAGRCAWVISSYVDAQNGFGAQIRSNWFIRVEYDPAAHIWFWQDLVIK